MIESWGATAKFITEKEIKSQEANHVTPSLQLMAHKVEQGIQEQNQIIQNLEAVVADQRKRLTLYKELAPRHVSMSVEDRMKVAGND